MIAHTPPHTTRSTLNSGSIGGIGVARLRKYASAEALADDWFPVRLALYGERKAVLEAGLGRRARDHGERARFIQLVSFTQTR